MLNRHLNPLTCSYTDAYDLFAVNFANIMVGYVYYPKTGALPASTDTAIKISTSCGTVLGQLGFGFLADHVGRKRVSRGCNLWLTIDVWY